MLIHCSIPINNNAEAASTEPLSSDDNHSTFNVTDNIVITNRTLVENTLIKRMISKLITDDIHATAERILMQLSAYGLIPIYNIQHNIIYFTIDAHIYSIASLENPFICDDAITNKLFTCPSFKNLTNKPEAGLLIHKYLPQLKQEYKLLHSDILISVNKIVDGKLMCELVVITEDIKGIGYYDLNENINWQDIIKANTIAGESNVLSFFLKMAGVDNTSMPDRTKKAQMTHMINNLIKRKNYTGNVISVHTYNNRYSYLPQVMIKVILASEQKLKIENIYVHGLVNNEFIIKRLTENPDLITKTNITTMVATQKLICSDILYEDNLEEETRNIHIYITHANTHTPIKDIVFSGFDVPNSKLLKIAHMLNIRSGERVDQIDIQKFAEILKKLFGAAPNIQYADDNGYVLNINATPKPPRWQVGIDNMQKVMSYTAETGIVISPVSLNFHTIKNRTLTTTVGLGVFCKHLTPFTFGILPAIEVFGVMYQKWLLNVGVTIPIFLIPTLQVLDFKNKSIKDIMENIFKPKIHFDLSRNDTKHILKYGVDSKFAYDANAIINKYDRLHEVERCKRNKLPEPIMSKDTNTEIHSVFLVWSIMYEKELQHKFDSNFAINIQTEAQTTHKSIYGANIACKFFHYKEVKESAWISNATFFHGYSHYKGHGWGNTTHVPLIGYSNIYYMKSAVGINSFILTELTNTQKLFNVPIASLQYGLFISSFMANCVDIKTEVKNEFMWQLLASIGFIMIVDLQGKYLYFVICFTTNGACITIGSLGQSHSYTQYNMQKQMALIE